MSDNNNHEYMGDGVYAEFNGFSIDIRVNDHRNPVALTLEPQVLEAIVLFYKRIKAVPKKCPKCGCQVFDPFKGTTQMHDISKCNG